MFVNLGTAITDARHAATLLQIMPSRIVAAAKALGIEPAASINGRPHYADADLERIREHLASKREGK